MSIESILIEKSKQGDRDAFDTLVQDSYPLLRSVIRKMIGHPDDTEDLVQESILKAFYSIKTFKGDSKFSTWLCSIGTRTALDFLRKQKRWRAKAQVIYAAECLNSTELASEVGGTIHDPSFLYDVKEHISYCFTCVGRSLPPEDYTCLILREVLGLTNQEAAKLLGVTESVFRHRLRAAREQMEKEFEGLCVLVNKKGVCYQCKGLRDISPEDVKGISLDELPSLSDLKERIAIFKSANTDKGKSQCMHDIFWKRTSELEENEIGDPDAITECGISDDE